MFAAAFDAASSGFLLLEEGTGRIVEANRAFAALCGRGRDQIIGRVFWQLPLFADPEGAAAAFKWLGAHGRLENAELPMELSDGSHRLVEVSGCRIGGGRVQLELRDVTARNGARIDDRVTAQSLVASRAAAEFEDLQKALQSAVGALTESTPRAESTFELCDQVQRAAERAEVIAHELRACGGGLPRQPQPLRLNELIEAMHLAIQRRLGPDVEVHLDLDPDIALVNADPVQVRQIILKLAGNSREAMDHGGVFTIGTRNGQPADPELGAGAAGYVILAVSDNGPGLDDESWQHLFEPFFTTKKGGKLGLGLAVVHGIVRQNGGRIWARSEPGRGTEFRIYLPQAAAAMQAQPAPASAGSADRARAHTILLLEPNNGLRSVLAGILRKRGYCVLPAREARDALQIAQSGPPDLLISRGDGDFARSLQALEPRLRTLFLNGQSRNPAAGVATLAKPFDLDALLGKIRELLAGVR